MNEMPSKILKSDLVSLNLIYGQLQIPDRSYPNKCSSQDGLPQPFETLDQCSANLLKEDKIQLLLNVLDTFLRDLFIF